MSPTPGAAAVLSAWSLLLQAEVEAGKLALEQAEMAAVVAATECMNMQKVRFWATVLQSPAASSIHGVACIKAGQAHRHHTVHCHMSATFNQSLYCHKGPSSGSYRQCQRCAMSYDAT